MVFTLFSVRAFEIVLGSSDLSSEPPKDAISGIRASEFVGTSGVDRFRKFNSGFRLEVKFRPLSILIYFSH